jgi:hypothetical protein
MFTDGSLLIDCGLDQTQVLVRYRIYILCTTCPSAQSFIDLGLGCPSAEHGDFFNRTNEGVFVRAT